MTKITAHVVHYRQCKLNLSKAISSLKLSCACHLTKSIMQPYLGFTSSRINTRRCFLLLLASCTTQVAIGAAVCNQYGLGQERGSRVKIGCRHLPDKLSMTLFQFKRFWNWGQFFFDQARSFIQIVPCHSRVKLRQISLVRLHYRNR